MQTVINSPADLAALFGLPVETATAAPAAAFAPVALSATAFDLPRAPKLPTSKATKKTAPVIIRATVTPASAALATPNGLNPDYQLSGVEKIRAFIFGGNSIFTLANKEKGTHCTYKVTCKKEPGRTVYFVSVLSGPDNTSDYSYIGYCTSDKAQKIWTKRDAKQYTDNAPSVIGFNWLLTRLAHCIAENKPFPAFAGFYHVGSCCKCGRRLTTPESVQNGIGPECAKK
jgi:hypothetical protein